MSNKVRTPTKYSMHLHIRETRVHTVRLGVWTPEFAWLFGERPEQRAQTSLAIHLYISSPREYTRIRPSRLHGLTKCVRTVLAL